MRAGVRYTSINGAIKGAWRAEHTGNSTIAEIVIDRMPQRRDAALRRLTRLMSKTTKVGRLSFGRVPVWPTSSWIRQATRHPEATSSHSRSRSCRRLSTNRQQLSFLFRPLTRNFPKPTARDFYERFKRPPLCSSRLSIADELRSCECPGLLQRFCPGQQVRREPPSRDIVSVEIDARPTICEADFVAAELGDGFVLADADGGGHAAIKAAFDAPRKLSIRRASERARATARKTLHMNRTGPAWPGLAGGRGVSVG